MKAKREHADLFTEIKNREDWDSSGISLNYKCVQKEDTLIIYFQESDGKLDWISNLNAATVPTPYGQLHCGFWIEYNSGCNAVKTQVQSILLTHREIKKIIITGWSNGGAMANLFAHDFNQYLLFYPVEVVTFGAPRLRLFFKMKKEKNQTFYSYQNRNDIVTKMPPFPFRNEHGVIKMGKRFTFKKILDPWKYHTSYDKDIKGE